MISTKIPKLNKEQTKQLVEDLNRKTPKNVLSFWKSAIEDSKKIKIK